MEISQHIKNLLKTNSRIILGGFGAFNTKHVSAKYDAETNTMIPPHKIVSFDPTIKEDAGILAEHMAEQEGISLDSANEQIQEYVKTINSKLSTSENVIFKDLGSFRKAPDGTLRFSFLSKDNLLIDSFGLSSLSLDDKKDTIPAPPVKKKPFKKKEIVKETPVKKEPIKEKPVRKEQIKEKPVKQKPVKQRPVKQKPVKQKSTEEKPKKRRRGLKVFFIFLLVIGIVLTAVYFFKPVLWTKGYNFSVEKFSIVKSKVSNLLGGDEKENYDIITPDETNDAVDTSKVVVENTESKDSTAESKVIPEEDVADDKTVTEEVVKEVTTNTTVSLAQKGKYYIIVGSVASEASAKKEQSRFTAKGISTSIIHEPSKGRYRLSAGEFSSAKDAQNAYTEIQSKHGKVDAWVWGKK